jgi:predicted secreted hydrolase
MRRARYRFRAPGALRLRLVFGALVGAAVIGCQASPQSGTPGAGGPAGPTPGRTEVTAKAPQPIQLEDVPPSCEEPVPWWCWGLGPPYIGDDAPHDALTEWWYYTGHLTTDDGRRFGFEFVVFQTIRGSNPIGYLSHFAITDEANQRFSYGAQAAAVDRVPSALDLDVAGWKLAGRGGQDRLMAITDDYALELDLSSQKPPALHHGGLISFGPAGDSYYFSRTRMAASGRLRLGDSWSRVTGQAWHDHQWGNFIVPAVGGWDWISLQLDDNRELMLTVLRAADGGPGGAFGSLIDAEGQTIDIPGETISVQPTGTWTSPHTGANYPSGWQTFVNASPGVPAAELVLTPVLADQELAFDRTAYWEGAVDVVGTLDGRETAGEGYVELTGYMP